MSKKSRKQLQEDIRAKLRPSYELDKALPDVLVDSLDSSGTLKDANTWEKDQDFLSATFKEGPVYDVTHPDFGASAGSDSTSAIQSAIEAAGDAGGGRVYVPPATSNYLLARQGSNPYGSGNYCLDFNRDNVDLWIPAGATLQLGDDEMTDASGEVHLIVFQDRTQIRIRGRGRITGNTGGQSSWTGGYSQQGASIIRGHSTAGNGNTDVEVSGLQLDDHYGNPTDLRNSGGRGDGLLLQDLLAFDCGEGFHWSRWDYHVADNLRYEDRSDVAVGDAIEPAQCDWGIVKNCQVGQNGEGAAVDGVGCKHLLVSNILVESWNGGFTFATVSGRTADDILVTDSELTSLQTTALEGAEGTITYENVYVHDTSGFAAQFGNNSASITDTTLPPVVLKGCRFDACNRGVKVTDSREVRAANCISDNHTNTYGDGWLLERAGSGVAPELHMDGCTGRSNGRDGFRIDGGGSSFSPAGSAYDCDFTGNSGTDVNVGNGGDFLSIEAENNRPVTRSQSDDMALGQLVKGLGGTLTTLNNPHQNQKITILQESGDGSKVIEDGSGNLELANNEDWRIREGDRITLRYSNGDSVWYEESRAVTETGYRREVVDGWFQDDVAASQTDVNLSRGSGAQTNIYVTPTDGQIVGVGVRSSEARTGGTLTVEVFKNGGGTGLTAQLDSNNTTYKFTEQDRGFDPVSAADRLVITVTTDSNWAPNTADINAFLIVEI